MSDKKISDFTAAGSLATTDLYEIENIGGNSRKATGQQLLDFIHANEQGWTLVDQSGAAIAASGSTWTWSTNVAQVDVIGLARFNQLLIIARGVSASSSGVKLVRVSVDNGSTFYSSSGDYVSVDQNGVETATTAFAGHSTNTTSARSIVMNLPNTRGAAKACFVDTASTTRQLFVASTSDINAIRFLNAAGNLAAGSLYVMARV